MGRQDHEVTPTTTESLETLVSRGYRKTSNAYCIVSRIDRPDWLQWMAANLGGRGRAVADFYDTKTGLPSGSWCDHYRRVRSKDTLVIPREMIQAFPTSSFDNTGFVPQDFAELIVAGGHAREAKHGTDDQMRVIWEANGGKIYPPSWGGNETEPVCTMTESKLLHFLRRLLEGANYANLADVASRTPK